MRGGSPELPQPWRPAVTTRRGWLSVGAAGVVSGLFKGLGFANPRDGRYFIPRHAGQLIVSVAESWSSNTARLWRFERNGQSWRVVEPEPIPVLLGRNGLAWGRGVLPVPPGEMKQEGDGKAPAGCFALGRIYGNDARLPEGASYPYRQVTPWDAWPDDPRNPHYNQHVVVNPADIPPWFEKQKMRLNDPAYHWLVEIRHNMDPKPVPNGGSAIFFHIRRGPDRPSSGCTTMAQSDLLRIIRWLRVEARPHYVLLPKRDYRELQPYWNLPHLPSAG